MSAGDELVVEKIVLGVEAIVSSVKADADPAKEICRLGACLTQIGEALNGLSLDQSRRVIASVAALRGIQL